MRCKSVINANPGKKTWKLPKHIRDISRPMLNQNPRMEFTLSAVSAGKSPIPESTVLLTPSCHPERNASSTTHPLTPITGSRSARMVPWSRSLAMSISWVSKKGDRSAGPIRGPIWFWVMSWWHRCQPVMSPTWVAGNSLHITCKIHDVHVVLCGFEHTHDGRISQNYPDVSSFITSKAEDPEPMAVATSEPRHFGLLGGWQELGMSLVWLRWLRQCDMSILNLYVWQRACDALLLGHLDFENIKTWVDNYVSYVTDLICGLQGQSNGASLFERIYPTSQDSLCEMGMLGCNSLGVGLAVCSGLVVKPGPDGLDLWK